VIRVKRPEPGPRYAVWGTGEEIVQIPGGKPWCRNDSQVGRPGGLFID
jgi:hypothetical protein